MPSGAVVEDGSFFALGFDPNLTEFDPNLTQQNIAIDVTLELVNAYRNEYIKAQDLGFTVSKKNSIVD